ncbi:uncharacterized protein LTR77_005267 [Saxophila tyrrhenica]|uniref:Uncharacterized protein n=1 Tax=Saxophila tyrrhenica TaxID=1690608 RepID=A0AAV9PEU3_9PEZI|nr:hypothetical protein LTR77_005267 [Saxophila tyrrhenica]
MAPTTHLVPRDSPTTNFSHGDGAVNPAKLNNQIFLGLFASLGGLMVLASLWFFFWAKNGGFHWQEDDWDDYKSTVLRRKGPDGKTLSNATKSTKLGGSTIAGTQRYPWEVKMQAKSVVSYDEKGRKGILAKRGWGKTHSVYYSDNFTESRSGGTETISDMTEVRDNTTWNQEQPSHHSKRYRDRDVREYKKERPARVGGLNRVADGSGVNMGASTVAGSDVYSQASSDVPILPHHQHKPPKSSTPKNNDRAAARARDEAAKMERRWKKEAEEAAASLARESIPAPKKSVAPSSSKPPSPPKHRQASRSSSPKKRDFSYGNAGPGSEVLSTAYTGSSGQRSGSYYDAYRPKAEASQSGGNERERRRESSPRKKAGPRSGGYRRGADSDLE